MMTLWIHMVIIVELYSVSFYEKLSAEETGSTRYYVTRLKHLSTQYF